MQSLIGLASMVRRPCGRTTSPLSPRTNRLRICRNRSWLEHLHTPVRLQGENGLLRHTGSEAIFLQNSLSYFSYMISAVRRFWTIPGKTYPLRLMPLHSENFSYWHFFTLVWRFTLSITAYQHGVPGARLRYTRRLDSMDGKRTAKGHFSYIDDCMASEAWV